MRSRKRKKVKSATPNRNGEVSSRRRYRSRVWSPDHLTRLLYHSPVRQRSWPALAILLAPALTSAAFLPAAAASTDDRLERFRSLAGHRLAIVQLGGAPRSAEDE